jgi:hypothetical protein
MLLPSDLWQTLHGFDPLTSPHLEDSDLCLRGLFHHNISSISAGNAVGVTLLSHFTTIDTTPEYTVLQKFSVRCPCQAQSSKRYVNSVFVGENLKRKERKPIILPQLSSLGSSIAAAHKDLRLPPFYKLYTSTLLLLLLLSPYLYFPHAPPLCPVPPQILSNFPLLPAPDISMSGP